MAFNGYTARVRGHVLRLGAALLGLGALLSLPASGAEAAFPGTNGLIAFERGGDIYTVTTDGDDTVSLLYDAPSNNAIDPAWSPDGNRLAFSRGGSIYVLTIAGSTITPELDTGTSPAWSPDGTLLVYEKNSDIWVISATPGGTGRMLADSGSASDDDPAWSPGSINLIAFTRTDGDEDVYLMTAPISATTGGGGGLIQLTTGSANEADPSWSPAGDMIAFVSDTDGVKQIYEIAATGPPGPGTRRLTNTGFNDAEPSYSPEGDEVAFARAALGIYVDGSQFTSGTGDANPDWGTRANPTTTTPANTAPVNTVPPKVIIFGGTGIPVVGVTVSSSIGTWTGGALTFSYQWKKCQPKDGPCYRILTPAANFSTFVPTGDLIGWSLRIEITAKNSFGETTAQSESTPLVIGNPPVNTVRPRISEFATSPTVGQQLTVDNGSWTGLFPLTYRYEWRRCDPPGTLPSCVPIPGATTATYTTTDADLGLTLRVYVTATNPGGSTTAFTDHTFPTIPVPRLAPSMTAAPKITGDAQVGETLRATRGSWSGFAPLRFSSAWQRCDATVTVCRSRKVKGLAYKVTAADLGFRIRFIVVARNSIGLLRGNSDATEPIVLAPPEPKGRRIIGTARNDYIPGGGGDDILSGLGGHDTIRAGKGDDSIRGGAGNDYIDAGAGVDRVDAGDGSDTVLVADGEIDTVECGAGNDRVIADPSDVLSGCEAISFPSSTPPDPDPDPDPDTP